MTKKDKQEMEKTKRAMEEMFGKEIANTPYTEINANPKYNRHKRKGYVFF